MHPLEAIVPEPEFIRIVGVHHPMVINVSIQHVGETQDAEGDAEKDEGGDGDELEEGLSHEI